MANNNYYAVYDFETSGIDPEICQPLSLGVVIVHPKKLEIVSEFYSLIKFENLEELQSEKGKEALEKNKLKIEDLEVAPSLQNVWKNFVSFIKQYKMGSNSWGNPIAGGYNIVNYDNVIINRLAKRFNTLNKEGKPDIFHPRDSFDCMLHMFSWLENKDEIRSYSFDNMRKFLGITQANAHNSLEDSRDAAKLMIRLIKMYRNNEPKMRFAGAFANG